MTEPGRVDRADPERAVRQVEAVQIVAVADELRDDLAEAEGYDREVVAAQAQRREADQDPADGGHHPRDQEHEPDRDVDPGRIGVDADRAKMEADLLARTG